MNYLSVGRILGSYSDGNEYCVLRYDAVWSIES
jgi:hypothetical protein